MANIFVFGSNTEGRHGAGAALAAKTFHGAIYSIPRGPQGGSYAIVTKDLSKGTRSIPLVQIRQEVLMFLGYAAGHPNDIFNVSPIGCGLAGYTPEEIAPMFKDAPSNIILPEVFMNVLYKPETYLLRSTGPLSHGYKFELTTLEYSTLEDWQKTFYHKRPRQYNESIKVPPKDNSNGETAG